MLISELRQLINKVKILNEEFTLKTKFLDNLKGELENYNNDEELLRSGGISNDTLDRLAFGFAEKDIKTLMPDQLKIRWFNDLENVKQEIKYSGLSSEDWAKQIDLSETIEVDYWSDNDLGFKLGFYIQDGHHRYTAAKILNKPLNVELRIKANPIAKISNLDYDAFHRDIFKKFKNNQLDEDFSPTIDAEIKKFSNRYIGRNVIWYGDKDQMIVIHKDNVYGMDLNIYYPQKLEQLKDLILNHEDKIELECSYGMGNVISIMDVEEEQQSYYNGDYMSEYTKDEPETTGDNELDKYIGLEIADNDNLYSANSDLIDLMETFKLDIAKGIKTVESFKNALESVIEDDEDLHIAKKFLSLEMGVFDAIKNEYGTIGTFKVQLRDGHHRVKAAIETGEEYVCVNLKKDELDQFKGHYQKVN